MTKTDLTIRPFEVHVPDKDLADLRRRVVATRWLNAEQPGPDNYTGDAP